MFSGPAGFNRGPLTGTWTNRVWYSTLRPTTTTNKARGATLYLQPAAGSLGRRLRIEVSCICLASSLAGMLVSVVFFSSPSNASARRAWMITLLYFDSLFLFVLYYSSVGFTPSARQQFPRLCRIRIYFIPLSIWLLLPLSEFSFLFFISFAPALTPSQWLSIRARLKLSGPFRPLTMPPALVWFIKICIRSLNLQGVVGFDWCPMISLLYPSIG